MSGDTLTITIAAVGILASAVSMFFQYSVFERQKSIEADIKKNSENISSQDKTSSILATKLDGAVKDVEALKLAIKDASPRGSEQVVSREDWHSLILSMTESAHKVEKHYMELKYSISDLIETSEREKDYTRGLSDKLEAIGEELGLLKIELDSMRRTVEGA